MKDKPLHTMMSHCSTPTPPFHSLRSKRFHRVCANGFPYVRMSAFWLSEGWAFCSRPNLRLVEMTLVKDVPLSIHALVSCLVSPPARLLSNLPCFWSPCKGLPFNGVCRRCRQPGHIAHECRNAWERTVPEKPAATGAPAPTADTVRPAEPAVGPEGSNAGPTGAESDPEFN